MASATYRFECAKQGRAGCQNKACKDENVKIGKGELRFGTLVTIQEHTSWKWKHWGCVTPKQIGNIIEQLGGLDGLNLDKDLDILDGYEELPPEHQGKIRYALENGHINDDDWKGDPELNRPGQKGINKRTPKKVGDEGTGDSAAEQSPSKPRKGGRKKKADSDTGDEKPVPAKKKPTKKRKAAHEDGEVDEAPPNKKATKAKSKKAVPKEEELDSDEPANEPPQKKRTAKAKTKKAAVKEEEADSDEPLNEPTPKKSRTKKTKQVPDDDEEAALPQVDGAAELNTGKAAQKVQAKKRGRKAAVKEESDVDEDPAPQPAARPSRGKKVKAEVAADDEDILDDVDKKKQSKKARGKKAVPAVVPEESKTAIKEDTDGDESDIDDRPAKAGKRKSRASRGSRTSRSRSKA